MKETASALLTKSRVIAARNDDERVLKSQDLVFVFMVGRVFVAPKFRVVQGNIAGKHIWYQSTSKFHKWFATKYLRLLNQFA